MRVLFISRGPICMPKFYLIHILTSSSCWRTPHYLCTLLVTEYMYISLFYVLVVVSIWDTPEIVWPLSVSVAPNSCSECCSLHVLQVKSIEEHVRASAEHKLGVANQSITAGFFDDNTRYVYLKVEVPQHMRMCIGVHDIPGSTSKIYALASVLIVEYP